MPNRLHRFEVHNIQKIKDVVYEFDKTTNALVVCGKNKQGKTSLMDSIAWLFCGDKLIPENPIRDGEDKGHVECVTDDFIVRKDFKYSKSGDIVTKLTVTPVGGKKEIKSPQTELNKMLQNRTINPVSLINEHPRKLRDILVNLVDLTLDLDEHEKKRQTLYDERTVAGRVADQKKAFMVEIPLPDGWEELPQEHVLATNLNNDYQEAVNVNAANDRIKENLATAHSYLNDSLQVKTQLEMEASGAQGKIRAINEEILAAEKHVEIVEQQANELVDVDTASIEAAIAELQAELATAKETNAKNQRIKDELIPLRSEVIQLKSKREGFLENKINVAAKISNNNEVIKAKQKSCQSLEGKIGELVYVELSEITGKIERVQETNEAITIVKQHFAAEKDWENAKAVVQDYTDQITALDKAKDNAISMAKFPVSGLSVDSKGIIYNGRRFEQASTAEQIDILISIHFALNPGARFIIIHDAAVLDKETMAHLITKAEKEDFDIIFERIETDEKIEGASKLIIHDGERISEALNHKEAA
jgi:hypothetical protein